MGQQEQCNDRTEPEQTARPGSMAPWLRRIAACALALTIGLGQAYADEVASGHEGGQGSDKSSAFAAAEAFAGDGTAHASSTAKSEAFGSAVEESIRRDAEEAAKVTVTVKVEEEGVGTEAWTRTVTRTKVTSRFVSSVTRSQSYATDEDGNRAIAKAVSKARAPNNVAAVRNGAGSVTAKTSVDVTGNGVASADAGGSIGIGSARRQGSKPGAAPAPRCSRQDFQARAPTTPLTATAALTRHPPERMQAPSAGEGIFLPGACRTVSLPAPSSSWSDLDHPRVSMGEPDRWNSWMVGRADIRESGAPRITLTSLRPEPGSIHPSTCGGTMDPGSRPVDDKGRLMCGAVGAVAAPILPSPCNRFMFRPPFNVDSPGGLHG